MVGLITLGAVVAGVLLVLGLHQLVGLALVRRSLPEAVAVAGAPPGVALLDRGDALLRRVRPGRWLQAQLVLAGVRQRAVVVLLLSVGAAVALAWLLAVALAPALSVLGVVAAVLGTRAYVQRGKDRRREAFVAQMPELARVLANAANAGLSLPTALAVATDELADPARSELGHVSHALGLGASVDRALAELGERVPSREVGVLVSTLVVSARSGGSLVSALRDVADTLDQRTETRREIRTTLAQATATGYTVLAIGVGVLFLLDLLLPGTVEAMTTDPLGQLALAVAGLLFSTGVLLIRRLTRVQP